MSNGRWTRWGRWREWQNGMIRSGVWCGQVGGGAAELDRAQVVLGQLSHTRGVRDHGGGEHI